MGYSWEAKLPTVNKMHSETIVEGLQEKNGQFLGATDVVTTKTIDQYSDRSINKMAG